MLQGPLGGKAQATLRFHRIRPSLLPWNWLPFYLSNCVFTQFDSLWANETQLSSQLEIISVLRCYCHYGKLRLRDGAWAPGRPCGNPDFRCGAVPAPCPPPTEGIRWIGVRALVPFSVSTGVSRQTRRRSEGHQRTAQAPGAAAVGWVRICGQWLHKMPSNESRARRRQRAALTRGCVVEKCAC